MIGICSTDGTGLWSKSKKMVAITKLQIAYVNEINLLDSTHGELRVYFDKVSWQTTTWQKDVGGDGLIYTDVTWIEDLRKLLIVNGFSKKSVSMDNLSYSEMGMQGEDYVSLDVSKEFLIECDKIISFTKGRVKTIDIELDF